MKKKRSPRQSVLLFFCTLCPVLFCSAEEFNAVFLMGTVSGVAIAGKQNAISPGIYHVDVYVNKEWKGNYPLRVGKSDDLHIRRADFSRFDIKSPPDAVLETASATTQEWVLLTRYLEKDQFLFRQNSFQLDIAVPQARIIAHDKNWMPPELWDKGITGLFANYNLIYADGKYKDDRDSSSLYLTLNSGFNLADWHLRDNTYFYRNGTRSKWVNRSRYLEKSIPAVNASFRAGEDYTRSTWFDSVKYRGISLYKDLGMLPDSYRLYMPVVRGVAESNATVRIIQDERVIFQQSVPAGPFEFADLMPTGSRSDLRLDIEYDSGEKITTLIPDSSAGNMLRSGSADWAFYAGQFRSESDIKNSNFIQGEYSRGVNNHLTLMSGAIASGHYQSGLAGAGWLIPYLGTITASYQYASTEIADHTSRGGKTSVALNKYFATRTAMTLSATHSEKSYLRLNQSDAATQFISHQTGYRVQEKNSVRLAIDQRLPHGYGSVNASLYATDYWNTDKVERQFSLGWNNSYNQISWSIYAGRRIYTDAALQEKEPKRTTVYRDETYAALNLSIPWSVLGHTGTVSASSSRQGSQNASSVSWNEKVSERLRYNLLASRKSDDSTAASGYFSYASPWTTVTGNLTQGSKATQYGFSASGSVLLSQHGLLASPQTGHHFVILDAPGVADARVNGNVIHATNSAGKALLPYATPWRKNTFYLNADSASDIAGNIRKIAPWKGSISYVKYITDTRKTFSLRASYPHGAPLTFGAALYDKQGNALGYVAQGGLIHIKADVLPDFIRVDVDGHQSCVIKDVVLSGENLCTK